MMIIRLETLLPAFSIGLFRNPTQRACDEFFKKFIGFHHDLSPGGVYPAMLVSKHAVRSYRTISTLPTFKIEQF